MFGFDGYFAPKESRYTWPSDAGTGLAFRDGKPDFRIVMQKWLLAALNRERRLVSGTAQTSSCEPG
jgi:hypothetical protein